jgi:Lon protease-like protein
MTAGPVYLPIFPLPDLTFFPHTVLPLHIFEARYRAMITDCLGRDRRLAVVALEPGHETRYEGKPPVKKIAGAGSIVRCERLATGRFNIVVRGDCRIRIEREVPTDTLYRLAVVTPLAAVGADRPGVPDLAAGIRRRCVQIFEALSRPTEGMRESLEAVRSPAGLADQVASAMLPDAAVRQALLEELDVEQRLARLAAELDELLARLNGGR